MTKCVHIGYIERAAAEYELNTPDGCPTDHWTRGERGRCRECAFIAGADYERKNGTGAIEALRWAAMAVCHGCRNHLPIGKDETCYAEPIHDEIAHRLEAKPPKKDAT